MVIIKSRKYGLIIVLATAVLAGVGLFVALNIKTVHVSSGLKYRLTFGKMSAGEAARVVAYADRELMPRGKFAFARDAYAAVAKYHRGEYADDALLGVARTYLAERRRDAAYPWLLRVTTQYPRGSAVESGALERAVAGELTILFAKPPLDYYWSTRYLALLTAVASPQSPAWRQKFQDIIQTPFTLSATYFYEKELNYVVRETATRDARAAAVFYAAENIPPQLRAELRKRVNFGPVVSEDKVLAFIQSRIRYVDRLEDVDKSRTEDEEQTKAHFKEARDAKGLGELPSEWVEAFLEAETDSGWVAKAAVVGELKDITIAEILTYAGVDPVTGAQVKK